tara:strand:- start:52285 stop:54249 length:1965 start_codon:yes stop_codon:yes gene_type:complete
MLAVMIGVGIVSASLVSAVMLETKSTYRAEGRNEVVYNLESILHYGMAQIRYALDDEGNLGSDAFTDKGTDLQKPPVDFFKTRGIKSSNAELVAGPLPAWPKKITYLDPESSLYQHDPEGGHNAFVREIPVLAKLKQKVPGLPEPITMYAKASVQIRDVPIYSYALLLGVKSRLSPGQEMEILGPVQVNNDYLTGGNDGLTYKDKLMVAGKLYVYRDEDNSGALNKKGKVKTFDDGKYYESDMKNWRQVAINRWNGNVKTSVHDILSRSMPAFIDEAAANYGSIHSLIEPQRAKGEDGYKGDWIEAEKYAGKAGLYIYIEVPHDDKDDIEVEAYAFKKGTKYARYDDKHLITKWSRKKLDTKKIELFDKDKPGKDKYAIRTMKPNDKDRIEMTDPLRYKNVDPISIIELDITDLNNVSKKMGSDWNGSVYVEIQRVDKKGKPYKYDSEDYYKNQSVALRIVNGERIPDGKDGLSVATNGLMYIWGDFNTERKDNPPCVLAADSIYLLSKDWDDDRSDTHDRDDREVNSDLTIGAVLVGGYNNPNFPWNGQSQGIPEDDVNSSGVENIPRLVEDWGGEDIYIKGGVIALWHRKVNWELATWKIHTSAQRHWIFSDDFKKGKYPPGIPPTLRSYRNLTLEFISKEEYQAIKASFGK